MPSATGKLSTGDRNKMITELAGSYNTGLPAHDAYNHRLKEKAERWARKWKHLDARQPNDLPSALRMCDHDLFPNMHALLRIACILPVTTAESERANSTLKYINTLARSRTGDERLSSLVLLKVHGTKHLNVEGNAKIFCTTKPR